VLGLSFVTPAACGVALERPIERHLGGPLPTALGLLIGAAAMALADRRPQNRDGDPAGTVDGLALGLAQAAALAPGVSRNGATLTAARWRGFNREHANLLSRTVALPVILAAAALKGSRLRRRGLPAEQRPAFIVGTAASFASTLASQVLIRLVERDSSLAPYAVYRAGLAAVVLARLLRRSRRRRGEFVQLQLDGDGAGPAESASRSAPAAPATNGVPGARPQGRRGGSTRGEKLG
jgi:undecaprenyl-diphosphatase